METIANYPMNVTDCYKCGYFRKGGQYGEEEEIICDVHREIVEDFRKAMEE